MLNKSNPIPNSAESVVKAFRAAGSFLVTSHVSPDGDAIGSLLGIAHLLRAMGKTRVACALADPVPQMYSCLPGVEWIQNANAIDPVVDVLVIVDANVRERTGDVAKRVPADTLTIIIDHHLVEQVDGQVSFVDSSYAAAGEMVFTLYERAGVTISRGAAECLYVALITDTGVFRFSNTNPRSLRTGAALLETGIDHTDIIERTFDTMSLPRFELMRRVLERTRVSEDGRIAHTELYRGDMEETHARDEDIEGLINFPRNLDRVSVAILFRETATGTTKVSLRGRYPVNCAAILHPFGGGGHAAAAGATLSCSVNEARAMILPAVSDYLRTLR